MRKRLAKGEPLAPIAARIVMQFVDAGDTFSHIAPEIVSHVDEILRHVDETDGSIAHGSLIDGCQRAREPDMELAATRRLTHDAVGFQARHSLGRREQNDAGLGNVLIVAPVVTPLLSMRSVHQ